MLTTSDVKSELRQHTGLCRDWLINSIAPNGGSRAHFSPVLGWSRAYPETSGYIVTTLLALNERLQDDRCRSAAIGLGDWLISIREPEGCWRGGLYPYRGGASPSVFNTGQILNGLVALARSGCGDRFADAAAAAGQWLATGVDETGVWSAGHYRGHQPDYYSFVAWPMLDFADFAGEREVRDAAARVIAHVLGHMRPNGTYEQWGFESGRPAFTHTIAYTIQGLLESERFLGPEAGILPKVSLAMEKLRRQAELGGGKLGGTYDGDWKSDQSFQCLTGNAQVAICLLLLDGIQPDLREVNAASKLIEWLCRHQRKGPGASLRGALAGSIPLWGKYMRLRYPNWAVKFMADALILLEDRLDAEHNRV